MIGLSTVNDATYSVPMFPIVLSIVLVSAVVIVLSVIGVFVCCRKRQEQRLAKAKLYFEQVKNFNHDEDEFFTKKEKKQMFETEEDEVLSQTNPNAFLTAAMLNNDNDDEDYDTDEVSSQETRDKVPMDLTTNDQALSDFI